MQIEKRTVAYHDQRSVEPPECTSLPVLKIKVEIFEGDEFFACFGPAGTGGREKTGNYFTPPTEEKRKKRNEKRKKRERKEREKERKEERKEREKERGKRRRREGEEKENRKKMRAGQAAAQAGQAKKN